MENILESGQIRHEYYGNNEDLNWPVNSDCETVHILSTLFKTERNDDEVTIDEIEYSGEINVNQIVPSNFTVYFESDNYRTYNGFILNWSCTQWGEWTQMDSDGTCNQEMRPIQNGTDAIGHLKFRKNSTCGK